MNIINVSKWGGSWWTGYKRIGRQAVHICRALYGSDVQNVSLVSVIQDGTSRAFSYEPKRMAQVLRDPFDHDLIIWG